jgi:hypothetical protein
MVLAMFTSRVSKTLSVILVLLMVLGALPAQLFLISAMAEENDAESRGLLPSDESFTETGYRAFDTDNNSKRDALEARYTVRTGSVTEQVSVLIRVEDSSGNVVKTHYDNFTAFLFANQERNWTFYAHYSGRYRMSLTLYDSQSRQEDTDRSGFFFLNTGTVKRWITLSTTGKDIDNDTFKDDVEVHVTNWTGKDVSGAMVWINGSSVGKTNASGLILGKNYPNAWINIDVFWKDLDNSTAWKSEGDGSAPSGLSVRAVRFDSDGDSLEDDVTITVTNQLGLPVRNAQISLNRTDIDTTDISGELDVFDLKRGHWIVNASKLNNFGSTTFFSEGQGPGTSRDEYFFEIEMEVINNDNDDRFNDLKMRFDVDVDPPVESDVQVWANLSHRGNGTTAYNVSTNFTVNGTKADWHTLVISNITYGMYNINFTLLDTFNNSEDFEQDIVRIVRPSNHVNVETGVFYEEDDNEMDDALFRTLKVDQEEPNINIKMFNETDVQVRNGKTNKDGRLWFRDLRDGVFNWTATDTDGRLVEKGRIVIGSRVQVDTNLDDLDFDGFFDDFSVDAYNNVDRAVSTVSVTIWAPNGTEVTNNITLGGNLTTLNMTKGTYEFNATYLGEELANGTFYSYGNVDESFKVVVLPEARDLDKNGRYDDVNVTVVDTDDSPLEYAGLYVDGVYKTKTDLNGTADIKDLSWGIHTIEARYSGERAKAQFFSEGRTTDRPTWTVLVSSNNENLLDDVKDVGSTNDSILLYYAENTIARPKASHLWIVLKGLVQEIDLSRLGLKAGAVHDLEDSGVLEAIIKRGLGHYSAQRTAYFVLSRSQNDFDGPFAFERELTNITTDMSKRIGLVGLDTLPWFSSRTYEMRTTADFVLAYDLFTRFPVKAMAQRVTSTPTTMPKELGEYVVGRAINAGNIEMLLLEMSKMGPYAQALDSLTAKLVTAYPDEGWNVQDARNVSGIGEVNNQSVVIGKFADELANRANSGAIVADANALKTAVSNLEVKLTDSRFGFQLGFPNITDFWTDEYRTFINGSDLAVDTNWDEFLDEFWRFRNYTIIVEATAFDADSSGSDNDVVVHVNDTYGRDIQGARVHIDLTFRGTTDAAGELESYNYTRGIHRVNVTWGDYTDETLFTSEGTIVPNVAPSVDVTDPDEDDELNGTYAIRGSSSDSDGSVVRVDVRFNGSAWQTAVGRANWRYDWDTTQVADGDWLIEARSYTRRGTPRPLLPTCSNTTRWTLPGTPTDPMRTG